MEQQTTTASSPATRLDEQTMFRLIAERQESGLSVKSFCEKHQLSPHTYYYWNKKYRNKNKPATDEPVGFSLLGIKDTADMSSYLFCELITPSGKCLRFYQPVSVSFLQSLL